MNDGRGTEPGDPAGASPEGADDVHDFAGLWSTLAMHAKANGLQDKATWCRRTNDIYVRQGHRPRSEKTFYCRLSEGRRVGWDETRCIIAAVPGLDPRDWKPAWERAEKSWHAHRGRPKGSPDPDPDPTDAAPVAGDLEPEPVPLRTVPPRRRPALALALAAVGTATAGVLAIAVVGQAAGASDRSSRAPVPAGIQPSATSPTPPAASIAVSAARTSSARPTTVPAPRRAALPTGPPSSSARSAVRGAHAEFHRDTGQFVIFDDKKDDQSGVLELRVDGVAYEPVYNSRGKTETGTPAKLVTVPGAGPDAVVQFRVCVAESGVDPQEESCGAWARDAGP